MFSALKLPQNGNLAPTALSISEQKSLIEGKKISNSELVSEYFDEITKNKHLNIYITEARDSAAQQAKEADERISKNQRKPLDGIPIAVKDNYCTRGIRTTAASRILENFVPTYESTVTQKLLDAGAVILGKTNMDEFAMGSSTESSYFGPTINPVGTKLGFGNLVPGGSSGGSAAAVAANLAAGALGTDTGGSIRQPASFCGVVGMKPTYGACSRWGIIAYGSSLDQAGVFGKCVEDVAILLDVIAGEDPKDTTSVDGRAYAFSQALGKEQRKLRIAFPKEVIALESTSDADKVWDKAQKIARRIGAEIVEVSMPSFKYALPAYYIIALSEASSNLARYDGVRYGFRAKAPNDINDLYERTRAEGFGREVKRRILLGTFSLSAGYYDAYYLKAQKVRNIVANEFRMAFENADVMFMPTAPSSAFPIGAHSTNPVEMYLEDVYTVPINLGGLPAISLPVETSTNGMPLGLQVIGPQFGDENVLRVAASVEKAATEIV
ncbi:Asp-tRNA(Asn)/Glu-tRNA(Gln) amidotransferase subunit GatA [Rhodobium gokarnense]|uniref:Glutamyl-tRNA(Gln) amidotransferase subunit A n=1 Tax=Rhodobium gokarnense TaxID=364296 RepID=A0ABT3HEN4_9HYPH|nr:Asp-tRNA(Asn)/Glu-tRNA(Gln) amidotransferase subunit GatA [Rhodobium gokarnense]MCW2308861.1 aspartyl-tRNA(Asn)/glutamyl-tRNA(Gln) amidotransferase subunit A [Rhodobium gokarnense]